LLKSFCVYRVNTSETAGNGGIVNQSLDRSQFTFGRFEKPDNIFFASNISLNGFSATAGGNNLLRNRPRFTLAFCKIDRDRKAPLAGQCGDCRSNAAAGPGYDERPELWWAGQACLDWNIKLAENADLYWATFAGFPRIKATMASYRRLRVSCRS